jgi:hypothetical protein
VFNGRSLTLVGYFRADYFYSDLMARLSGVRGSMVPVRSRTAEGLGLAHGRWDGPQRIWQRCHPPSVLFQTSEYQLFDWGVSSSCNCTAFPIYSTVCGHMKWDITGKLRLACRKISGNLIAVGHLSALNHSYKSFTNTLRAALTLTRSYSASMMSHFMWPQTVYSLSA